MRQSELFTKTQKEAPKDEMAKNAQLLERAGFIYKNMAGVYSFLPLGLRVLEKIVNIIREEMNAIGGQELHLPSLQKPELWAKTNRWNSMTNWFTTKLKAGAELGLAATHEEPITEILSHHIDSYKDLPKYVYQFQTKFRNEERAKSGLLRLREFLMKDLYSFVKTEKEQNEFYEKCAEAYYKIFNRVGLGDRTYRTFASGGEFSKFSDEFQTLCDSGEDTIYLDEKNKVAVNIEVYNDEVLKELGLDKKDLKEKKAVEVGNIFKLGTRFSEPLGLTFKDEDGVEKPVIMGSYGIGPGRLMGTIVENHNDENGIIWPKSIAPFAVHLISLGVEAKEKSDDIYDAFEKAKVEVLYDDREDKTAGEKFADADLIGIPLRIVVSKKTLEKDSVEVKNRSSKDAKLIKIKDINSYVR